MSSSVDPVLSALRRADQVFYEQLSQVESLDFGIAFFCPDFPLSPHGNQFREVLLGQTGPAEAYESVERLYQQHGLVCRRWVPALGEPVEALAACLQPLGWARRDSMAFVMEQWPSPDVDGSVRILPARAMRRALRATVLDAEDRRWSDETKSAMADELNERLNDANYDVFVAMVGDAPAGRVGYQEAGDIGMMRDLYVMQAHRGRGVGRALLSFLFSHARRMEPRIFVAEADAADGAARSVLEKAGFRAAGTLPEMHRHLS